MMQSCGDSRKHERGLQINTDVQSLDSIGLTQQASTITDRFRGRKRVVLPTCTSTDRRIMSTPDDVKVCNESQCFGHADCSVAPLQSTRSGAATCAAEGLAERLLPSVPDAAPEPAQLSAAHAHQAADWIPSLGAITCHFCQQVKICKVEDDCPRCTRSNPQAQCLGSSSCSRCNGATGRFCRSCLGVRYGISLSELRAQGQADSWLCPHCYEEQHPLQGWMCNSPECMTERGMQPIGIAIFEAQAQGFESVAHMVQHRILTSQAAESMVRNNSMQSLGQEPQ